MLSRLLSCIVSAALLASVARGAESHVKTSLVAAESSIQPGRPFTVALRLEHEPHWHTYWINAGTGYPTSLSWKLPDDFKAGGIQWPVPSIIRDAHGTITGNGYEGETFLPVQITPPASLKPGETITLRAHIDWLMCSEVCIPGQADVSLQLPVRSDPPRPSEWSAKIAAQPMPRPPSGWDIQATREAKTIVLRLQSSGPTQKLNAPHFFSEDGFIQYDQPQIVREIRGGYELVLPISESANPQTTHLVGVLATENPRAGLRIDVPVAAAMAVGTTAATNSQPSTLNSQLPASLPATLFLAFIGGLILNLMPCVFPVLGIKILGFVQHSGSERGKVVAHGLVFSLGVLLSFWALAGLLAVLRAGGHELGWGFQLQSPGFVFALTAVLLIFALNLSGVFEFGLSATSVGGTWQTKSGLSGTFFSGIL
ncbi:MAG: hypothetical protein KGJ37_02760, partial [Verrucomicrobiota bacterium]|nr:hypothetical protein [Verrucomicrobiota bacterium]